MKLLIARLNHETNTFSPVPTPLESFNPSYDHAAYLANKGMRTPMAAFIDAAEALGATLVTPVSAMANPSGTVHADAYDALTQRIIDALPGCDAILLDLHGAMTAENAPDGEGALLERVRAAAPGIPIGVALDLHGNLTEKMVANADVMVGFKTYPHVDMYETGAHAARLLLAMATGGPRYRVIWRQLPLMSHTLRSTTLGGAMLDAVNQAKATEQRGVAAMTVFGGFSLSDIHQPFVSVVATVEDTGAAYAHGKAQLDQITDWIWSHRQDFVYRSAPLETSLQQAQQLAQNATRPVLLLDHGDNCMSGGTCDTMDVLQTALSQGLESIAMGPICDPEAVAQAIAAGEGTTLALDVGNKVAMPQIGRGPRPLRLTGTVRRISDGSYTVSGPIYTGQTFCMGRTVLLDAGAVQVVICEQTHEPWDLGVFHCVGLDPTQFRYLLLKSRMYCRPVFVPLSAGLVECDSPGVTTSDYSRFSFTQVQRPAFPLDAL
ncbi:MAG: M81 family metallopeptidase [Comamonas sp.]